MSFYAYNAVRACSRARGSALAVLHEIADRINDDDNYCHVSVERLAQDCHMSERQAHRGIAQLVASGDLVIVARTGRTNLYYIPLYKGEPGYRSEDCRDAAHRCRAPHAPLELNRRDLMRGLLSGGKPPRGGGGDISDTPITRNTISTADRGVPSATPRGAIRDTPGVPSATPRGAIRDTQTLSEPPSEPPVNVDTFRPSFLKSGAEPERPLRFGADGMPVLSPRMNAAGVRRLQGKFAWAKVRQDIAHDRLPEFDDWHAMHYWPGGPVAISLESERECEYKQFITAIVARKAAKLAIQSQAEELTVVE